MKTVEAFKEFNGNPVHGKGTVRKTTEADKTFFTYVFENEKGRILFNKINERDILPIRFTEDQALKSLEA